MSASRPDSVADPFSTAPNTPVPPLDDLPHPQNAPRPSSYLSPETVRTSVVTNNDPTGPETTGEGTGSATSSRSGSQLAQLQPDPQPQTPDPTSTSFPELDGVLLPPRASFFAQSQTPEMGGTPRESIFHTVSTEGLGAAPLIPKVDGGPMSAPETGIKPEGDYAFADEAAAAHAPAPSPGSGLSSKPVKRKPFFTRRLVWISLFALAIALIVLAVVLPVYFVVIKPKNLSTSTPGSGGSGSGSGSGPPVSSPGGATSGGNGSIVTTSDGSTFTYINPFGGYCKHYLKFLSLGFPCLSCPIFLSSLMSNKAAWVPYVRWDGL